MSSPAIKNNPEQVTEHHVPPRSRGKTMFTLKKKRRLHEAYHALFANAGSLEECVSILEREWWSNDQQLHGVLSALPLAAGTHCAENTEVHELR